MFELQSLGNRYKILFNGRELTARPTLTVAEQAADKFKTWSSRRIQLTKTLAIKPIAVFYFLKLRQYHNDASINTGEYKIGHTANLLKRSRRHLSAWYPVALVYSANKLSIESVFKKRYNQSAIFGTKEHLWLTTTQAINLAIDMQEENWSNYISIFDEDYDDPT